MARVAMDVCTENGAQVTVEHGETTVACPTVQRDLPIWIPVDSGCEPACEGDQTCHLAYQPPQGNPPPEVYSCVNPATLAPPEETRDDSLVCTI